MLSLPRICTMPFFTLVTMRGELIVVAGLGAPAYDSGFETIRLSGGLTCHAR
jgi:hypothetical protein